MTPAGLTEASRGVRPRPALQRPATQTDPLPVNRVFEEESDGANRRLTSFSPCPGSLLISLLENGAAARVDDVVGAAALEGRVLQVVVDVPAVGLQRDGDAVTRQAR